MDDLIDDLEDTTADLLGDELAAARQLLGICTELLPHGLLRVTIRQVSEGSSAVGAWRALTAVAGIQGG